MARERSDVGTGDAELLQRSFTTDDPENLPGLVLVVPESEQPPIIEFSYDLTPPGAVKRPFVRCVHCKYPNHWKGYVMRAGDGQRFLVGKDCGAKLYGAHFTLIERSFSIERSRQQHLRRLAGAHRVFPHCLKAVASIKDHQALRGYQHCWSEMQASMRPLWSQLVAVATRGSGVLTIAEKVRDYAAELRRAERQKSRNSELEKLTQSARKALRKEGRLAKDDDRPIYMTVDQPIGQLAGRAFFQVGQNPAAAIARSHARLQHVFKELEETKTDDIPTKRLALLVRELSEAVADIDRELERLETLPAFFARQNLDVVCAWASQREECDGTYKVVGDGIEWENRYGDVARLDPPSGFAVPRPAGLEVFKLALTQ